VIGRALARDPQARWTSAAEFALALNPAADAPTGQMPIVAPASSLNTTYDVQDRIWTGRLGSDVYKGVHRALGHPVAIRILREGSHPNWTAARERFLREAKSLQVAHESVLHVRDFGEEPGLVYIVTDYIEGPTVRQVLTDEGRIPWPRLRPLLDQLLDAVRALHRRNAVVCGLNPEIMRIRQPATDEDQPRLIISTAGIWNAQDLLATLHEQTLRGMSIQDVELRYVAPELLTGGAVDVRSDVFTIGVLAYEMATGKVPFDGRTMHELLGKMLAGAPEDPRTHAADLPDPVARVILRALRPPPAERFQRMREFVDALG
jgi:serine/threonine-protein kinase